MAHLSTAASRVKVVRVVTLPDWKGLLEGSPTQRELSVMIFLPFRVWAEGSMDVLNKKM